jgi:predicted XRE-type DNA-binding protein
MPSTKQKNKPGHVTNGDIFDDLGLSQQEVLEAKVKSDIWKDLMAHIDKRALDQAALKKLLKIHQPDVSNLIRGKISKFSTSKLITFAIRLELHVQVQLTPQKMGATVSKAKALRGPRQNRELVQA